MQFLEICVINEQPFPDFRAERAQRAKPSPEIFPRSRAPASLQGQTCGRWAGEEGKDPKKETAFAQKLARAISDANVFRGTLVFREARRRPARPVTRAHSHGNPTGDGKEQLINGRRASGRLDGDEHPHFGLVVIVVH